MQRVVLERDTLDVWLNGDKLEVAVSDDDKLKVAVSIMTSS